ncbi:MAG TPA: hypothetical protein VEP72_03395 [Microbacterium sp.]|nr:hypothetical protein [Microbacterium sp.]
MTTVPGRKAPLVLLAAALFGIGSLALAGCASNAATPASTGGADDSTGSAELEVEAGWLNGGAAVALVTYGSSGCVPSASEVTLQADGSVAVTLEDPTGDVACTADYAPRGTLVELPDGVDAASDLELVVSYNGARDDIDLDAFTGTAVEEYAPSAGWIDDGTFAILTWGSSSCAPVVQDVIVAGAEVTVTFATPAADQVCTMDMAPRVTLATTPDASDDATSVTLTGGTDFQTPVTVPIYG